MPSSNLLAPWPLLCLRWLPMQILGMAWKFLAQAIVKGT
jgi:hypothetical protein